MCFSIAASITLSAAFVGVRNQKPPFQVAFSFIFVFIEESYDSKF